MSLTWSILLDMDSVMDTEWEMLTPAAASSVSILLPVADVIASVWLSHTHTHKM